MKRRHTWRVFADLVFRDMELIFAALTAIALLLAIIFPGVWSSVSALVLYFATICLYIRKYRKTAVSIAGQKHLPVVVVSGKERGYAKQLLEDAKQTVTYRTGFKQFKQVEDFFNVNFDNLLIHRSDNLDPSKPDQWKILISRIQREIGQFSDHVTGDKIYHLFLFGIGITSLAIGLGAVFGTRSRVVVYQLDDDEWAPVIDLSHDIRRLKEMKKESSYRYINVSVPHQMTPEVALVLNLSSHSATGYVENYLKEKGLSDLATIIVDNTYGGNLQESDWTVLAQEVFGVYSQIHEEAPLRIHLFHNMPTALGFGLGVALGIYNQVTVYCWDPPNNTYCPVFSLNELESLL